MPPVVEPCSVASLAALVLLDVQHDQLGLVPDLVGYLGTVQGYCSGGCCQTVLGYLRELLLPRALGLRLAENHGWAVVGILGNGRGGDCLQLALTKRTAEF